MTVDVGIRFLVIGAGQARQAMSSADAALTTLTNTARRASRETASFGETMMGVGRSVQGFGRTLSTAVTLPIIALGAALLNTGIEFQDAFQGVAKTIDGVADSMGNLTPAGEDLKNTLIEMSLVTPVPSSTLANLGQLAGQFGETIDTVEIMIDTLAKLQVSTDLVSESQLQAFAQVSKLVNATADEYDNLGSALVFLGNNFATTESAIISFSQRIAGTTTALGFSADATLAWGAAVTASGITAQTGATALRKAILEMTAAVDAGGKSLRTFADLATKAFEESGMTAEEFSETFGISMQVLEDGIITAEEFAQIFGENASGALELFVNGLAGLEATEAIGTLDELGLGAQRVGATLINLSENTDVLRDALSGSAEAWKEQVALNEEAQKKFATLKSAIQTAKNAFTAIGDTIATLVADDIKALVDGLIELVRNFLNMDESGQKTILVIAGIAAAAGPVLIVLGGLVTAIGAISAALTTVVLPALAVAAAIGAIVFAFVKLSKNQKVQAFLTSLGESFKKVATAIKGLELPDLFKGNVVDKLAELAQNILPTIKNLFEGIATGVASFAASFADSFTPFVDKVGPDVEALFTTIGQLIDEITPLLEAIGTAFTEIFGEIDFGEVGGQFGTLAGEIAGITFEGLVAGLQSFVEFLVQATQSATTFFTELPGKLDEFGAKATEVFNAVGEAFINLIGEENFARLQEVPEKAAEIFNVLKDRLMGILSRLGTLISEWVSENIMPIVDRFVEWAADVIEVFSTWASDVMETIQPIFDDIIAAIKDWAEDAVELFQDWVDEVLDWFEELYDEIVGGSIIPDLINDILDWINTLVTDGVAAFGDFVDGVIEVVSKLGTLIGELIGTALSSIFDSLGDGEGLSSLFDLDILNQTIDLFGQLGTKLNEIKEFIISLTSETLMLFETIANSITVAIENFNMLLTTISLMPIQVNLVTVALTKLNAQITAIIPSVAQLGSSFVGKFVTPALAATTMFVASFEAQFTALLALFRHITRLMVGHWQEFAAAVLAETQMLKTALDSIFTRLEKDNVVKFKVMGREWAAVARKMAADSVPILSAILDIEDATGAAASSFSSLGSAAWAAAEQVQAAADAMCQAMQEAESCITSSPELSIQHPFERFSSFLKTETPKIEDNLANMFAPAISAELSAARVSSSLINNNTTITEDNSVSVTGVPANETSSLAEQLLSVQRSQGGNR